MRGKIKEYIETWERRCYPDGIPDEAPAEIADRVPSYKRIAMAILKNDVTLKSLGFTPPESEYYGILKRIELGIPEPKKHNMATELLVSELKQFKSAASGIKANNILPVLAYLKVEPGKISKNQINQFVTMAITYTGKPFLIEESVLMDYAARCHGDVIEVKVDKDITLKSQGTPVITCDTMPLTDFPAMSQPDGELKSIDIEPLLIASKFCNELLTPERGNVFVGSGYARACDGFVGYSAPLVNDQKLYIPSDTIRALKGEAFKFIDTASYHFFESGLLHYGFIKPEYKYLDFVSFFKLPDVKPFKILSKLPWIEFNDMAISTAISKIATTLLTIIDGALHLHMKDNSYNRELNQALSIEGGTPGQFGYNPALLNRLLKAVPDETLNVYHGNNIMYFTGPADYWVALIMELK